VTAEPKDEDLPDLVAAERRWATVAGGLRYEDIPAHMIRPLRVWRPPKPDYVSGATSSLALCADLGSETYAPRKPPSGIVDIPRMKAMLASGMPQKHVAAVLGVSPDAIRAAIKRELGS